VDSTTTFWLGILIAIPVSLGVNLVTPFFSKVISRYSGSVRAKLQQKKDLEMLLVNFLAENPHVAALHFIRQYARMFLAVIAVGVSMAMYAWMPTEDAAIANIFRATFFIAMVIGMVLFERLQNKLTRIWVGILKANGWPGWDMRNWSADHEKWVTMADGQSTEGGQIDGERPRV
jgi:hypothetical protein